eukprot:4191525-Alexandrium_andersonii.AAC.1
MAKSCVDKASWQLQASERAWVLFAWASRKSTALSMRVLPTGKTLRPTRTAPSPASTAMTA